MKIVRSRLADTDLDSIFDYTAENWGVDQATKYIGGFDDAFIKLASDRNIHALSAMRSGYRRLRQGEHFIFYLIDDDTLRIERILHARMDAAKHLP